MKRWMRFFYQPVLPLGPDGRRVTGGKDHIALSREAAAEGMVLLKNENGVLPFSFGKKIAVFGKGCVDYVKGGGGSGDVTVEYTRSLLEGLRIKEQEGKIALVPEPGLFYEQEVGKQRARGVLPGMTVEPEIPEELLKSAAAATDTAVVTICRFSGEGWDRTIMSTDVGTLGEEEENGYNPNASEGIVQRSHRIFERGDFYLSAAEQKMVEQVQKYFPHVVAVLNVGGMVDTAWFKDNAGIEGALLAWQGGMEGGLAAADLLVGDENPSGRLTDTFAERLEDYPSSEGFHESEEYVEYTEDIYVGYRYFETMGHAREKVCYPFGYGLSYTDFEIEYIRSFVTDQQVEIDVFVTNMGKTAGKEVIQLYVGAPQGKLGKPARELKAFAKTRLLQAGESQTVRLVVSAAALASYDDGGKVEKNAWVLEKGSYAFYLGENVRDAVQLPVTYDLAEDVILERTGSKCAPVLLSRR